MLAWFNKKPQEIEIGKFIADRSWRKFMVRFEGLHGEVKAGGRQRKRQDLGTCLY